MEGEHSKFNLQSPEVSPGQVQCVMWQKPTGELYKECVPQEVNDKCPICKNKIVVLANYLVTTVA